MACDPELPYDKGARNRSMRRFWGSSNAAFTARAIRSEAVQVDLFFVIMPGPVPGVQSRPHRWRRNSLFLDGRIKPGHDESNVIYLRG
jgi:hypothetical protein